MRKKLSIGEADKLVGLLRRAVANNQFAIHAERKATEHMAEVKDGSWTVGEETYSGDCVSSDDYCCDRMTVMEKPPTAIVLFSIPFDDIDFLHADRRRRRKEQGK